MYDQNPLDQINIATKVKTKRPVKYGVKLREVGPGAEVFPEV